MIGEPTGEKLDSEPQAITEPLLSDKLALFLALPVPWARDGKAAGVADGVTVGGNLRIGLTWDTRSSGGGT